jgi:hypothetical protein
MITNELKDQIQRELNEHGRAACGRYVQMLLDEVDGLQSERDHLRRLVRCETIQPPADVTDDQTTELAVELAYMREERDRLAAEVTQLQELIAKADMALTTAASWAGFTLDNWDNDRDAKVGKCLMALWGRLPRYAPDTDLLHAYRAEIAGYRKQPAALAARREST